MSQSVPPDSWQTFFNLGGIAGALSLLWQVFNALWGYFRRPRLRIIPAEQVDLLQFPMPDNTDERRYVTLRVRNDGRRSALRCTARAQLIGTAKDIGLHWADTAVFFETVGVASQIDIEPKSEHRLDVAFSSRNHNASWLASIAWLHRFDDISRLGFGESQVDIRVTYDDGNIATCRLLLRYSGWQDLNCKWAPQS